MFMVMCLLNFDIEGGLKEDCDLVLVDFMFEVLVYVDVFE